MLDGRQRLCERPCRVTQETLRVLDATSAAASLGAALDKVMVELPRVRTLRTTDL